MLIKHIILYQYNKVNNIISPLYFSTNSIRNNLIYSYGRFIGFCIKYYKYEKNFVKS